MHSSAFIPTHLLYDTSDDTFLAEVAAFLISVKTYCQNFLFSLFSEERI